MNTTLEGLRAELELIKEANNTKYKKLIGQLNSVINKLFISDSARLLRSLADTDFNNGVFFRFDIGFYNNKEDKIDWGSEIDFTYESKTGLLSINHGCIGTFNKNNVCQFHRAAMISCTFRNIDSIEEEFCKLVPFAKDALNCSEELRIEREISRIENEIKQKTRETIEKGLVTGAQIVYSKDCNIHLYARLFTGTLTITKTTPKYIFLNNDIGETLKLKKLDVVNNIYNGNIKYA